MSIFDDVKQTVDIKTAAEYYGLTVKNGIALCPFHNERTGSMKLYADHFHCFGCGEHGDVIKLTGQLLGLSPIDSAKRLAADFNVIIHNDILPHTTKHQPPQQQPQQPVNLKEIENRAFRLLIDYCRYLEYCKTQYAPKSPQDTYHPLFELSLLELEHYRYYCDIFIYGDEDERIDFIAEHIPLLERLSELFEEKAA